MPPGSTGTPPSTVRGPIAPAIADSIGPPIRAPPTPASSRSVPRGELVPTLTPSCSPLSCKPSCRVPGRNDLAAAPLRVVAGATPSAAAFANLLVGDAAFIAAAAAGATPVARSVCASAAPPNAPVAADRTPDTAPPRRCAVCFRAARALRLSPLYSDRAAPHSLAKVVSSCCSDSPSIALPISDAANPAPIALSPAAPASIVARTPAPARRAKPPGTNPAISEGAVLANFSMNASPVLSAPALVAIPPSPIKERPICFWPSGDIWAT